MPPRHAYWTIIIDDQPTAFRAHDPEELLPTLNRLKEKNQTAVMKWFERGQLFDSRDAARESGLGQGERRWEGPRPDRDAEGSRGEARGDEGRFRRDDSPRDGAGEGRAKESRGKTWRPGGEHRDPRQKYKDAKKAKWTRFKQNIRNRHEERTARTSETFTPPHGDKLRPTRPTGPAAGWEDRDGRPSRPHGDKFGDARDERSSRAPRDDDRGGSDWRDRPPRRDNREEWRDRPPRRDDTRDADRSSRPPHRDDRGESSWSNRPPRRDDRGESSWSNRPPRRDDRGGSGWSSRPPRRDEGRESDWRDRPPRRDDHRGGDQRERPPRRDDDRGGWKPKPPGGGFTKKPFGKKPFGARPSTGGRKPWGAKPEGQSRPPSGGFRGRKPSGPGRRRDDDE